MRSPARIEPIMPPRQSELRQLRHGDGCAFGPAREPSVEVVFRPEEQHRPSWEADVLPPRDGRDEDVEEEIRAVRGPVPDIDRDAFATIGARALDPAIDVERGADSERVPRAVREPRPTAGLDAEGRRDGAEGVRHPDLAMLVEDQGMGIVESVPGGSDVRGGRASRLGDLAGCRRSAQLDGT